MSRCLDPGPPGSGFRSPVGPAQSKLGGAASGQLSGLQRLWRQPIREGSPQPKGGRRWVVGRIACANWRYLLLIVSCATLTEEPRDRILPTMIRLPPARAETTEAFLMQSGPELAALCTECGACFNACPMVDYVSLRGADPKIVTSGLRRLASGEAAPEETVAWVGACTKSGQCVDACPQKAVGLDAMLLVRIAKQRAINETRQLPTTQDPSYFPRIKTFARLQLSDEEREKWL
jgi:ferredoxin